MTKSKKSCTPLRSAGIALLLVLTPALVAATEPCGDLGACKALVEINASDGDIGFHFLLDGSDLRRAGVFDPAGKRIFDDKAFGPLREQGMTETFLESAEPLCWNDPEADPDEEIVTLEQFLERWSAGTYTFYGFSKEKEVQLGTSPLTFGLPAAPTNVAFDGSVISWEPGEDLGRCADAARLDGLVDSGALPSHPRDVDVMVWEVVLEPDVDDGDPTGATKFSIRVPGDIWPLQVSVPSEYVASLPEDTPAKVEILAIGFEDNATAFEEGGFCLNEVDGCDDD